MFNKMSIEDINKIKREYAISKGYCNWEDILMHKTSDIIVLNTMITDLIILTERKALLNEDKVIDSFGM